jgi:hypothetical protein
MNATTTDGAASAVKTTGLTKEFGERRALDGVALYVPRVESPPPATALVTAPGEGAWAQP